MSSANKNMKPLPLQVLSAVPSRLKWGPGCVNARARRVVFRPLADPPARVALEANAEARGEIALLCI